MKGLLLLSAVLLALPCMTFAGAVPDTGQADCYNDANYIACQSPGGDYYGQDAQYSCNPRSYTDLGTGIVRDNITDLEWQQNSPYDTYRWQEAVDYCNNLELGGHSDWRLPSIKELSTLVDSSIPDPGPTVNVAYFPDTVGSAYSDYWSSDAEAHNTSYAWIVHFGDGSVKTSAKINRLNVRAVRGEQASDSIVDNGDGTITDPGTGLMWEIKTDDGGPRDLDNACTWQEALAYCENLALADYDDWRLPNRNELQSLIDYGRYGPSIDPVFPYVRPSSFWSSTTNADNPLVAWLVNFYDGDVSFISKSGDSYVRAVRAGQCRVLTTTSTTSIPPTTIPDDNCPSKKLYGGQSEETELLREFRDSVLSKTAEGQEIIKLYYLWSPAILAAMERDEAFRNWVKETIDSILPVIESEVE